LPEFRRRYARLAGREPGEDPARIGGLYGPATAAVGTFLDRLQAMAAAEWDLAEEHLANLQANAVVRRSVLPRYRAALIAAIGAAHLAAAAATAEALRTAVPGAETRDLAARAGLGCRSCSSPTPAPGPARPALRWATKPPLFAPRSSGWVCSWASDTGSGPEQQVTHTVLVPTMLAAVTDEQRARPRDVSSLSHIAHGAAPIATETLRRARAAFPGVELLHIYGATETSTIVTTLAHEERLRDEDPPQCRSCGQPAVGVDVAIVGLDGTPVAVGEVGEVAVRGPNVMAGYWNKPEQTAAALVDGWYRTGDLGYQDARGYLYLVDRAKDMIVTGGENVFSTEVEEALYRHPAVAEAAVFGIPDSRWGEAVHAVVVPRAEVDPQALIAHCRELIAGYKVPKQIELRTEPLPKSAAGKLLKRELRAPYWKGRTEAVAGA